MKFSNIQPLLLGETVISHATRIALINGYPLSRVTKELFDTHITYPAVVPTNLQFYAEKLAPITPSAVALLSKHTVHRAVSQFLCPEHQTFLAQTMLSAPGHGTAAYRLFSRSHAHLAWCPECAKKDIEENGIAYWHCAHQLPGVALCPSHHSVLLTTCGRCNFSVSGSSISFLPSQHCGCGAEPRTIIDAIGSHFSENFERIRSKMMHDLFAQPLSVDISAVGEAIYQRARDVGLINNRGFSVDQFSLIVKGKARIAEPAIVIELLGHQPQSSWLARSLRQKMVMNTYSNNILIATLLFESATEFNEISGMMKIRRSTTKVSFPAQQKLTENPGKIAEWRARLEEYLRHQPTATRSDVRRELGYVAKVLRQSDGAWYENTLPPRCNYTGLNRTRPERLAFRREKIDVAIALWIETQHQFEINKTTRPKRIEKKMILKGGPGWTSVYNGTEQDYPKSYALLKDYIESKEAFLIRKARWILSNDEINASSRTRVGQAVRSTGLSRDVVQMLNSGLRL